VIITATDAKNRLGQVLEHAQTEPVFIEEAGRRHSVVMSVAQYDALLAASGEQPRIKSSKEFYERYKDWVDEQNRRFEERGLRNDELRTW
jgi:prevent-host-death family protein